MSTDSTRLDPSEWSFRIHEIWKPVAEGRRVIPFCTPIHRFADALVIGINHSDFVAGGGRMSEQIADSYCRGDLTVNTFLIHGHKFAHGLRSVAERAGLHVTDKWMGTNRCAVQTGTEGIDGLKKASGFAAAQRAMDRLLKAFVADLRPRNLILVGKYPALLWYPNAEKTPFERLLPFKLIPEEGTGSTQVIAIPHVSRGSNWSDAAVRLQQGFER